MTIDIQHNGTHVLNESDVRRLIDDRDALAAALEYVRESLKKEFTGTHQQLVLHAMKDDNQSILAAHDAAKDAEIAGLVEALRELIATWDDGLNMQRHNAAIQAARAAIAPYKETHDATEG